MSSSESTTGPEASMSTGSSLGRWLMMSDDRPPDYEEVDSPPTYLEATRGQYSWTRHL